MEQNGSPPTVSLVLGDWHRDLEARVDALLFLVERHVAEMEEIDTTLPIVEEDECESC